MSRGRSIRRWLARAGTMACIALIVSWIVSEHGRAHLESTYWSVTLHGGAFYIRHVDKIGAKPHTPLTWRFYNPESPLRRYLPYIGRFKAYRPTTRPMSAPASGPARPGTFWAAGEELFVPLWIPLLLVAVPSVYLLLRDRRPGPHCCQSCGYDLTGNTSGTCPECGQGL